MIGHEEIDRIDILQATFVAMRAAVQHLAAGHMGLVEHLHGGTATATVHGQDAAATTTVDGTTAAAIMTTETNTATASAGGSMLPCKQMDGVAVPMGQLQYCLIDGNM